MKNAPSRSVLAALLGAALLLSAGCRTPLQKRRFIAPSLSVSALFVEPFAFRWPEPAFRSFELSQKLLATADEKLGGQVLLFGPPEFRVYRAEDNGWAATNAVTLLPATRVKPENALLLRPWAEKRVASSRRELTDAKGRSVGAGAVEDVTYIGHVELVHPSSQTLAMEVVGEVAVDPFAEKRPEDEADPAPELTKLMQKLTAEALAELEGHVSPPSPARELPFTVAFVPQAAVAYAEEGRPPQEQVVKDPLEAEVQKENRVRYANPGLSDAEAAKLSRLPGGLYVTEAKPGAPVKAGELILQVGDAPALPQTLQRARFREGVLLKVRRADGSPAEVVW